MSTALWVAQGLVALAMLAAGAMKLLTPRLKLAEKQRWAASYSDGSVKLIGLAEVAGAIGLIVPSATGILPILTPIAAACLVVIMAGAARAHVVIKEPPIPAAILGLLCVFVALGRFGVF